MKNKLWVVVGMRPKDGGQQDVHVLGAFTDEINARASAKFCDRRNPSFAPYFVLDVELNPVPPEH